MRLVERVIRERAHRLGPLPLDEVLDIALYHPDGGFYATGEGAGRGGHFLTSPEVGPAFGAVIARALDDWWADLGHPDPFVVVEAGAGSGTLAADVLAATPRCLPALRYVLVERSPALRERQRTRLQLEPPASVLGPVVADDELHPDEGPRPVSGVGPLVTALDDIPSGPLTGVVIANELLDNIPFRLLERRDGAWLELRVADDLAVAPEPTPPDVAAEADRLVPEAPDGARIPLQHAASQWVWTARNVLARGRVVAIDYADTTPSLAKRPWTDWVRAYRAHGRVAEPLSGFGDHDVTCEVAVDQLPRTDADESQADFLRRHGVDDVAAAARVAWQAGAAAGDLDALRAKSVGTQVAALTDPDGMGSFRVLQWVVAG